jgi:hypothetical protein
VIFSENARGLLLDNSQDIADCTLTRILNPRVIQKNISMRSSSDQEGLIVGSSQNIDSPGDAETSCERSGSPQLAEIDSNELEVEGTDRGSHNRVPASHDDSDRSALTPGDFLKIFEIALVEIRSSQNVTFTVLGLSAGAIATMKSIHIANPSHTHGDPAFWIWLAGAVICLVAAVWVSYARHHAPLHDVITAALGGKGESLLNDLRSALNKTSEAVRAAHRSKRFLLVGFTFVVIALLMEFYDSMPN